MLIDSIEYGEVNLKGKTYYSDMLVYWNGKRSIIPKTHLFTKKIADEIIKKGSTHLILGVGLKGTVKISDSLKPYLKKKNIKFFIDNTMNAMEIYNAFVQTGKKAAVVVHVTL